MNRWELNEKNKNIVKYDIYIGDKGITFEEQDAEKYEIYCLFGKGEDKDNITKICFVDKQGIRFDYYNNLKRKEGQSKKEYIKDVVEKHRGKILSPEDLKFDKPLSEYVHFLTGPNGKKYIASLTKFGARTLDVINDNPEMIEKVSNKRLKELLIHQSPVLVNNAIEDEMFNFHNQMFFCTYNKNAAGMLESFNIEYRNKGDLIGKEYKLSLYHLRNKFFEVNKKINDPKELVKFLKNSGNENQYGQIIAEAIVHYNWEFNKNNPKFDPLTFNGFKAYKKPTLYDIINFFVEKRVIDHYNGVLMSELRKLPQDERARRFNEIYSDDKVFSFIDSGALEMIDRITGTNYSIDKEADDIVEENVEESEIDDENDMGVLQNEDEIVPGSGDSKNTEHKEEEINFDEYTKTTFDEEEHTKKVLAKKLNAENEDLDTYDVEELQYMANHSEEQEEFEIVEESVVEEEPEEIPVVEETKEEPVELIQNEENIKIQEPTLMEGFYSLYMSNSQFTNGKLLVPIEGDKQLEFSSYESVKEYIDANHITGDTSEELYHNFVENVRNEYKKSVEQEKTKEIDEDNVVKKPEKDMKEYFKQVAKEAEESKFSKETMYNALFVISEKLKGIVSGLQKHMQEILDGKNINFKKVIKELKENVLLSINPTKTEVAKCNAYQEDKEVKKEPKEVSIDDLYKIIKIQNEKINSLDSVIEKQNDKIDKMDRIISTIIEKVPMDYMDEISDAMKSLNENDDKSQNIGKEDI